MYLQNAEKVSNEVKSNKANILINVLHKQKSEKVEQRASIWKHTQPSEDRINSDSQNKKVTNKQMNYCSLEQIDYWYKQMDGMVE